MPMNRQSLISQYKKYRVSAAEAIEILRKKALADGQYYYIGLNKYDGWVEIFKSTVPVKEYELSPTEIDRLLEHKGLYLYATKSGFVTIRRVPVDENDVPPVREPPES